MTDNNEHIAIIRQGVEVWNLWRSENPGIIPELDGVDFGDVNRELRGANLYGANMYAVILNSADLRDANLSHAVLCRSHLDNAILDNADLTNANLFSADLIAWLTGANLSGTILERADLCGADLSGAILSGANLSKANLVGANLSGATLIGADLTLTNFFGTNLNGANLSDAQIGNTVFGYTDLSVVAGLEKVVHRAASSIDIDTIYASKGKIPEVFLRGCGLPEPFIVQIPALVAAMQPIQFYSCFISYSSKDHPFAERLHADLQNKGVRCWFAPEDLKIGDRFRDRIDESIRLHDKLLIVLSENSVASPWVSDEVESAIEREHREGRTVLFPIKIDEAVTESDKAWAATIRRTRHIGDFKRWKEHDSYSKAFDRLLRDLKAEAKRA